MSIASIEDVAAVGAIVQTVLVVIGLIYGLRQVQEARRSREATAILDIFQRLHARDASARRHRLYRDLSTASLPLWPEIEAEVRETINEFDLLGYLTLSGVVPKDAVLSIYYATTVRVWNATATYIEDQRNTRGTRYAQYFEQLVQMCRADAAERRPLESIRDLSPPRGEPGPARLTSTADQRTQGQP